MVSTRAAVASSLEPMRSCGSLAVAARAERDGCVTAAVGAQGGSRNSLASSEASGVPSESVHNVNA